MSNVQEVLQRANACKAEMARLGPDYSKAALEMMSVMVANHKHEILQANALDLERAKGRIPDVMLDRLALSRERIEDMAAALRYVSELDSPVPDVLEEFYNADGLHITKTRVPLGVVAIVYESRPNVTTDAAALCLRAGNVCVLRGGSEAIETNKALVRIMRKAAQKAASPADIVQLVEDTSHDSVNELLTARGQVDLLVPRGGKGLIRAVVEGARGVPVIETGSGICHIYVDKAADLAMALSIVDNAKTSRPSVCNAAEVCLVHREAAAEFLPMLAARMKERGVELRPSEDAAAIIGGAPAGPEDFDTEFNDYVLAVGLVGSVAEAIEHINRHSTHHSDAIVTADGEAAEAFFAQVDSAAVYHNASTRFTDGGVFGMGCEIGISTQKLGARGPMGLKELTSYKYCVAGQGQIRG